jgi:hypothetical protein
MDHLRVAATLRKPADNPDSKALSAQYLQPFLRSSVIRFKALDTCPKFGRFARVSLALIVEELGAFQIMGPYAEGAFSSGLAEIAARIRRYRCLAVEDLLMPSVLNN